MCFLIVWLKNGAGERNFHIFYQLLAGCNELERKSLFLENCESKDFAYLKAVVCPIEIEGVDDKANLATVRDALKVLGFDEKVKCVFCFSL